MTFILGTRGLLWATCAAAFLYLQSGTHFFFLNKSNMFICTLEESDSERTVEVICNVNTLTSCWQFALSSHMCIYLSEELCPSIGVVLYPSSHTPHAIILLCCAVLSSLHHSFHAAWPRCLCTQLSLKRMGRFRRCPPCRLLVASAQILPTPCGLPYPSTQGAFSVICHFLHAACLVCPIDNEFFHFFACLF